MKLTQLNLWQGRVAEKTIQFIKSENPDFLCAQEVYSTAKKIPSFHHIDIHEQLIALYPHYSFAKTHNLVIAGQKVSYGNAIYSRWPLKMLEEAFTNGKFQDNVDPDQFDYNVRIIQTATSETPFGNLQLFNHHGYHDSSPLGNQKTLLSHQKAVDFIAKNLKGPTIVAGDFNSSPDSPATKLLEQNNLKNLVTNSKNITSTLGTLSRINENVICDYVLVSNEIKSLHLVAKDELASDHTALILEFEL